MSENCFIHMKSVNMYYPSGIYNARSIKQELFSFVKREQKKILLKDVHALKNFSLDVSEGERIGVIGRNGSGKSTLLKTIAGIYPIESGELEVQGKIRAVFDIGLGFDLESTGRENIMYRGLLLGATPDEIRDKMDEIISFTDIGEFIDYPIKSYSTGMLVRLAFSVTTSVSGDVLLMDEVINAGDAGFIQKAQKKVREMMDSAKIMVLVSHDMATIKNVCSKVIWLDHGEIQAVGNAEDVVNMYLESFR